MSEFLVTCHADPIEKGQQFLHGLPLHLTIQQYFKMQNRIPEFVETLKELAANTRQLYVIGAEEAMLGPKNDVPVRRVRDLGGGALVSFHLQTWDLLQRFGAILQNPEWAKNGYNPHMALVKNVDFGAGDEKLLKTVELIERLPNKTKKVTDVFPFAVLPD
jgi:hypothetical protein